MKKWKVESGELSVKVKAINEIMAVMKAIEKNQDCKFGFIVECFSKESKDNPVYFSTIDMLKKMGLEVRE